MKNVTITLAEDLAAWARIEAAKAGKSLSRFISDRLFQEMNSGQRATGEKTAQRAALEKFLSGPGWPGISADLPSREELYAERLFHRHKSLPVRAGSERNSKGGKDGRSSRRTRRS